MGNEEDPEVRHCLLIPFQAQSGILTGSSAQYYQQASRASLSLTFSYQVAVFIYRRGNTENQGLLPYKMLSFVPLIPVLSQELYVTCIAGPVEGSLRWLLWLYFEQRKEMSLLAM